MPTIHLRHVFLIASGVLFLCLVWRWNERPPTETAEVLAMRPGARPVPLAEAPREKHSPRGESEKGPEPPPEVGSLAVLYFENTVDPEDSEHLGQMLTLLLTTELARTAALEVLTPQRLYDAAEQFGGIQAGAPDHAIQIARHLQLDTAILGHVTHGAQLLMVEAEIIDVENGQVLATRRMEGKGPDELFSVVESLGQQVSQALMTPLTESSELSLTAQLTSSLEAFRAYVVGEDLLHRHEFVAATESLQEAVSIDPSFAMAHYRLSIASTWIGASEEARQSALRAAELGKQFAPEQRNLFQAAVLFQEGRFSELLTQVETLLVDNPENKEALFYAAEAYLHSGIETHLARATEAMVVLHSLNPEFRLLAVHLLVALVLQDRWQEAMEHLDSWLPEEAERSDLRSVALALANRIDEVPDLPNPLHRVNDNYRLPVVMLKGNWEQARELALEDHGVGYIRSWHLRNRATLLTYRGEFEAAAEAYRESSLLHAQVGHEGVQNGLANTSRYGLAELLTLTGNLAEARRQAEEAIRLQPRQPSALYHAARLARIDGDTEEIRKQLRTLRQIAASARGSMPALFEQALEAELDLAEGNAQRALSKYQSVVNSGTLLHDFYAADSSSGAVFREGLANACRAVWNQACEAEALRGLLASGFERLDHPVLYVRSLFRLGELHLELGQEEMARAYFERFLEHWGTTDWRLPEVAAAREHLAH